MAYKKKFKVHKTVGMTDKKQMKELKLQLEILKQLIIVKCKTNTNI